MIRFLYGAPPRPIVIAVEPTLILDERSAPEPDILVHPGGRQAITPILHLPGGKLETGARG